ncbi:MAG: class I SAM-dependent methyltransferase [Acidimicrobiia bacterium]
MTSEHERTNREFWDADADDYQAAHAEQIARNGWGVWGRPETELALFGDVTGLDVLEYGCGGAQRSIPLAHDGAHVVALDQSWSQLAHATRNVSTAAQSILLVCASGESLPLADGSFDLVFCDHGAMSFCDPERSVPEVARVLRSGGRLIFNKATILYALCYDEKKERQVARLQRPYFGSRISYFGEGTVDFQIPYGEWIRLFRTNGLIVEDLLEIQPPADASTTYNDFVPLEWARQWPAEEIWVVRKQ